MSINEDFVIKILISILSPESGVRAASENQLKSLGNKTCALMEVLFLIIENSNVSKEVRAIAAVLIQNILTEDKIVSLSQPWKYFSEEEKLKIKKKSLVLFISDQNLSHELRKKVGNIIEQILHNMNNSRESWKELVTEIVNSFNLEISDQNHPKIETFLGLFGETYNMLSTSENFIQIKNLAIQRFKAYLSSSFVSLQVKCVKVIAKIIFYSNKDEAKHFSEFIYPIMEVTLKCQESQKENQYLLDCLESLLDICLSHHKLLKTNFEDLFILLGRTAENRELEDDKVRELAFEILITFIENCTIVEVDESKLMILIELLFKYALEIETEIDKSWLTNNIDTFIEKDFQFEEKVTTALLFVERLIEHLKPDTMLALIAPMVTQLLSNDSEWIYKYIGLLSVITVIKYVNDIFLIENLIPTIFSLFEHGNLKIRYAAIGCIGAFIEKFSSIFINNYHEKTTFLLLNTINRESILRCRVEAVETINSSISHSKPEIIKPYYQEIISTVLRLFETDIPITLREVLLRTIIELAKLLDNEFTSQAERVINALSFELNWNSSNRLERSLCGTYLEYITLIGPYVKNVYYSLIPNLVETICSLQDKIGNKVDPVREQLRVVYERLLPVVKINFPNLLLSLVNFVIALLKAIREMPESNKPETLIERLSMIDKEEEIDQTDIKTGLSEDIVATINLINITIEILAEGFLPYLKYIYCEVEPLLQYKTNSEVRQLASNTLPLIIQAVSQYEICNELVKVFISNLIEVVEKEKDLETMSVQLQNIGTLITIENSLLSREELNNLFDKIMLIFDQLIEKRQGIIKALKESDNGDVDSIYNKEEFTKDIEIIGHLQVDLKDIVGFMLKSHISNCQEVINKILAKHLPNFLSEEKSPFEVKMGILLIQTLIENLGQSYLKVTWVELLTAVTAFCDYSDSVIREEVAYIIGLFAQHSQKDFNLIAEDCLKGLSTILQYTHNKDKDLDLAKYAVAISLGKMIKYQSETINHEACIEEWLKHLPIVNDFEEIESQHDLLCEVIAKKPELILGKDSSNVERILFILTKICNTGYSSTQIDQKIEKIFSSLKSNDQCLKLIDGMRLTADENLLNKLNKLLD